MQFLLFLEVGIVLGYTLQGELVHKVDELGIGNVLLLEASDGDGVGGREEGDLLVVRHNLDDLGCDDFEIVREKFVYFVED